MKRFLITVAFLSVTTFSFAQTAIGVKVTDPLSAVSLAAPLYTATNVDLKNYNAFVSLGGFVRIPLKEHWVLQSELLFKHEAVRFRIENSSKDSYYRFEYLDVPFLVQYEGKKAFRGFGFVGFSPKILFSSSFYDASKNVYKDPYNNIEYHKFKILELQQSTTDFKKLKIEPQTIFHYECEQPSERRIYGEAN